MVVWDVKHTGRIHALLWVALGLVLLLVALGGYWFNQVIQEVGSRAKERALLLLDLEDALGDAGIELGGQIQEWKDALLRIHDPVMFAKHRRDMKKRHLAVQAELARAEQDMLKLGADISNLRALRNNHRHLLEKYESALARIELQRPWAFREADAQVRGIDRSMQYDLRYLKEDVESKVLLQITPLGVVEQPGSLEKRYYLIGLFGVLLLLFFAVFIAAYRLLRKISGEEAHTRTILQSIHDAVIVVNGKGDVEFHNKAAQILLGVDEKVKGKPLVDVFGIDNESGKESALPIVDTLCRDGSKSVLLHQAMLHTSDGRKLPIEGAVSPVMDGNGQILGMVMVFRDVSSSLQAMRQLEWERALFRETFNQAAVGIAHVSPEGCWLRVNEKLCDIVGYSEAELQTLTFRDITHPDDLSRDMEQVYAMLDGSISIYSMEKRYIRKDWNIIWVNLTVSLVRKEDRTPDYFISVVEDIQSRKEAEMLTLSSQEQYQALFEQMPEGVLLIDRDMRVVSFNQEALKQLEYSSEEMGRLHVWDFEAMDSLDEIRWRAEKLRENGRDDFESRYRTRSGRVIDVHVSVRMIHLPDDRDLFQCLFRDISEQKQAAQQIEYLAYHDHLTGLANRKLLQDRMERSLNAAARRNTHIALLFIDLDHFKNVNDTLGHEIGDTLLQAVAGRLLTCIRVEDTLARSGGDEFVIMLNEVNKPDDAAAIAQKVIDRLSEVFIIDETELNVTPSIGIAVYPQDGQSCEELLKHADVAMYHAKDGGRAAYRFYTEEVNAKALERMRIECLLHKAIEKNEFELYYQPQIDLRDGRIIGCEALIRWNNPEMGLVSPGLFIPVAEHSSMINQIGAWVIRSVCSQASAWQKAGRNFKVSFNVSARQFMHGDDLLQILHKAICDSGVDPSRLEMELTESLLLNSHDMQDVLRQIDSIGMRLALDDFGTGYSSLSYLRRFPISVLKIDRSFVSDADRDTDDAEMVRTIIGMAHNLRMTLVAEGVETATQAALLMSLGCEVGQGYHFGHPLPLDGFNKLLEGDIDRTVTTAIR